MWETHYHEIDTPSITVYPWLNFQSKLHGEKQLGD